MRIELSAMSSGEYPDDIADLRRRCFPHWYLEGTHQGTLLYRACDDHLVGYLIIQEAETVAYVEELAVDTASRGAGIARALVARAADDLVGRVERITVFPLSGSTSESRRAVFLALGFRPDPEHINLLSASPTALGR